MFHSFVLFHLNLSINLPIGFLLSTRAITHPAHQLSPKLSCFDWGSEDDDEEDEDVEDDDDEKSRERKLKCKWVNLQFT